MQMVYILAPNWPDKTFTFNLNIILHAAFGLFESLLIWQSNASLMFDQLFTKYKLLQVALCQYLSTIYLRYAP